jgi:hypothetical protein
MSTRVCAFIAPNDPTFLKHQKVFLACQEAGISLPDETAEYFDTRWPENYALEQKLSIKIPIHEYREEMTEGYEVFIADLPKGVFKIRFTNSW